MASSTDTLLIPRWRVAELATPGDYLSAIERAFKDLANAAFVLPPVGHVACRDGGLHVKSALRTGVPSRVAIKVNGNFADNPARHGLPTIHGFIALLDGQRGTVLALMDSIEITARRTAAATTLAARLLARSDSEVLGIVGCGAQARYHVQALLEIFAIRSVRFCEPRDHAAQAFCGFLEALPVAGHRVADSASAARGADIVVTLTTSSSPVLRLADIAQGTFVAGVGADNPAKHELAPDLLRSSLVVPDLLAQASTMGDLHHAIETGAMTRADVYAELADVIAGNRPGRRSNAQRFVFDSTGLAIQDIAAAEMIYERALLSSDLSAIALNELRSEVPHVRSRAAGPA